MKVLHKTFIFCLMINLYHKILLIFLTIFTLVLSSDILSAQSYHTTSKKAIKYFEMARLEFLNDDYDESLIYIEKALKYDVDFTDAILLKAELGLELGDDSSAMASFERVFEVDSMSFPKSAISLSKLYSKHFLFEKSIDILNWYLSLDNQKEILRELAEKELELANFRKMLYENPVTYEPQNIGNTVNTSADEYVNQYYVAENKLIFTRRMISETNVDENVYVSTIIDSTFLLPKKLLNNIETYGDIGASNISADGNEIFFSACSWSDGMGSCDIYYINNIDGKWSEPINLKSVNTTEWESQACLSYDGRELFFVRSNKHLGTSDIYVSNRDDSGRWSEAYRLDSVINTEGNEMAPFLHHDGKTLFFSSDTHLGMGGFDLFVSYRNDNNEWSKPLNLGYPLNTEGDEINLVVSNDATTAFVSTNRSSGFGRYDIYEFVLDENFRPRFVEVEKHSDEEYYVTSLFKQESVALRNIYFDFDSSELSLSSDETIDLMVTILNTYTDLKIEIIGHTDDMGNDDYNVLLSKNRADAVKNALINKGISSDRIKTSGLGASKPLVPNVTDEYRALNRRVEMKRIP